MHESIVDFARVRAQMQNLKGYYHVLEFMNFKDILDVVNCF